MPEDGRAKSLPVAARLDPPVSFGVAAPVTGIRFAAATAAGEQRLTPATAMVGGSAVTGQADDFANPAFGPGPIHMVNTPTSTPASAQPVGSRRTAPMAPSTCVASSFGAGTMVVAWIQAGHWQAGRQARIWHITILLMILVTSMHIRHLELLTGCRLCKRVALQLAGGRGIHRLRALA